MTRNELTQENAPLAFSILQENVKLRALLYELHKKYEFPLELELQIQQVFPPQP